MTIDGVQQFDGEHQTPPTHYQVQFRNQSGNISNLTLNNPQYYSTSGNADLNGNQRLEDNEAAPYFPIVARFQWNRIRTVQTFTRSTNSQGQTVVIPNNSILPLENDTAVSIQSARYPGFRT